VCPATIRSKTSFIIAAAGWTGLNRRSGAIAYPNGGLPLSHKPEAREACFADLIRTPIVSLSARANSDSSAMIIRACGCAVSNPSFTDTSRPPALSNWSRTWPT